MSNDNSKTPANIFALLGFALLFVVAIWSGIQIVKFAPRVVNGWSLSNMFKSEPNIVLKVDKNKISPDEELNLSWKLTGAIDGGAVSFLYDCKANAVFDVYDDLSKSYKTLPCKSPFNMPVDTKSLKIKAHETKEKTIEVPVAIVYTNAGGQKYKDIAKITIKNDGAAAENTKKPETKPADNEGNGELNEGKEGVVIKKTKPATTKTTSPVRKHKSNRCVSKTFGKPDLSIHNLKTGVQLANGYFVQKHSFSAGETITIKFTVSNNGTKTSPSWYFQALLPTQDGQIYTSKAQAPIAPCSGRYFTMKVANPAKGTKNLMVNVDPHNLIRELNEINNSASTQVTVY